MTLRKFRAFTLLELIVTIVILAILAALAIPTFMQVVSKSKLETAEVTIGSLSREVLALKVMSQEGLFTEETVLAAVGDLPLQAMDAGILAEASDWKVLFGATSFSVSSNILSVAIGGQPQGSTLGAAVYVPKAGCAYGLTQGSSVQTWSVLDAPVSACSGNVALSGPDSQISAPPAPGGLSLSRGECSDGEEGIVVDWDGIELAEVFVNGESIGVFGPGMCHSGLTLNDQINVQYGNSSNPIEPGDGAGGEEPDVSEDATTIGGVLTGEVIEISWDEELPEGATDLVIIRNGTPLAGPFSNGVHYDTVGQPGDYTYVIEVTYGNTKSSYPSTVTKISKPLLDSSSEAATRAEANGNTVRIQWGAVPDTDSAPLSGYRVYHARSSLASEWEMLRDMPIPVADTYYDHDNLALGLHCYYVTAYGPGGESDPSAVSCARVEILPTPRGMALSEITAGTNHVCGVNDGLAYCWGDASQGRLGSGSASGYVLRPQAVRVEGTPMEGKVVTDLTAASSYPTCAIASGEVFCWGNGIGAGVASYTPNKVNVDVVSASDRAAFSTIDTSGYHTCGVTNGKAYCWGQGWSGKLGQGSATSSTVAVAVNASGVMSGKIVSDIATGAEHTCALASGEVFCWGAGNTGQLGDGSFSSQALAPVKVASVPGGFTNSNILDISAADGQTCAVTASGQAYCWGTGSKLGNPGVTANSATPMPVSTAGALDGRKIVSLSGNANAGTSNYATCATTDTGEAVCWSSMPTLINFPNPEASTSVMAISIQANLNCALTGDGAYCWGNGSYGQFGNGTRLNSATPTPVNPL